MSKTPTIREQIRNCFKRTLIQTEGDTELFDTEITIDELESLISQSVIEGKIEELNGIQLEYGGRFKATTFVKGGYAQSVDERIKELKTLANKGGELPETGATSSQLERPIANTELPNSDGKRRDLCVHGAYPLLCTECREEKAMTNKGGDHVG